MNEMNAEPPDVIVDPLRKSHKRLWCAFASSVVPGLGDWFLGEKKRAAVFISLFALVLLCYIVFGLPRLFLALMVLPFAGYAVNVASCCVTAFSGRSDFLVRKLWALVLIPTAVLFCTAEMGLGLRWSGLHAYSVPSDSMSPTIYATDKIMVDQRYFSHRGPTHGEVTVFRHNGICFVKRVIALAGDTIQGVDDRVFLNGHELTEPYVIHGYPQSETGELSNFGPLKVPAGQVFVMGDNRDVSLDSRTQSGVNGYGPIYVGDLIGKPLYRYAAKGSASYDGQAVQ
jgi:signal peptidase I